MADIGEGMAVLGQQITKLMAALVQTGRAVATPVHQLVPESRTTDGDIVGGAPLVAQTPAVVAVVLARKPQPKIHPQNVG